MLLSLLSLASLAAPAHAESHGLVVRLEVNGETVGSAAYVVLAPPTGEPTKVEVKDNGTPPDVTAGDGVWAGSVWLEGDQFQVSLEVDGKTVEGGPASWSPDDTARDLSVAWKGGGVTIEAGVSGAGVGNDPLPGGTPAEGQPAGGPGAGAAGGPAAGGPPTGAPSAPGTPPISGIPGVPTSGKSNDGSLYIGFGLGVLVLVGVSWLWLRNRPAEGAARPGGLVTVPEPGLLGPGSPSLSDGLQLWIVNDDDGDAILRPLLATMARHHRVLVVAPSRVAVPPVYGGPVYRSANIRPSHVGDAAEALQREGGAVAALLAGTQADAASLKDYADLMPTGVGSVCLLAQDPGVPALARVTARRDGPVWVVQTAERTFRLVETPAGFSEEPAR